MRRTTVPRRAPRRALAAPRPAPAPITPVVVVVPARDEAVHIGACVRSIDRAAGRCGDTRTVVVVASDHCRDATASIARSTSTSHVELVVLEGRWHGASAARAAGVAAGLGVAGVDPASAWLANTDADCTVPTCWLADQLRHAGAGADAVAGVVALDAAAPQRVRRLFAERYEVGLDAHGHVHGANFGVRAVAYHAVGGWLARTVVGEEHDLLRRLERRGWRVVQPLDAPVSTSARLRGRAAGGFAAWLARLDASVGNVMVPGEPAGRGAESPGPP
jgi:glycosyltransferase involved in cell wall biosynthesis